MADTLNLLPCPFCGSDMKIETIADVVTGPGEVFVQCDCGAMGPGSSKDLDDAIAKWNRRAATKAAAPDDAPIEDKIGNTDHVGRGLEDMQQPYAGAIVLLETIAECGARPYIGNDPTPMRETCIEFANALRKAGRLAPDEDAREVAGTKVGAEQAKTRMDTGFEGGPKQAKEEVSDDIWTALEQAQYALKEATGLHSLGFNECLANTLPLGQPDETGCTAGQYSTAAERIRSSIRRARDMVRAALARRASSVPAIQGTGREKTCTCPSGDGSLRWPCQVHPLEAKAGEPPCS